MLTRRAMGARLDDDTRAPYCDEGVGDLPPFTLVPPGVTGLDTVLDSREGGRADALPWCGSAPTDGLCWASRDEGRAGIGTDGGRNAASFEAAAELVLCLPSAVNVMAEGEVTIPLRTLAVLPSEPVDEFDRGRSGGTGGVGLSVCSAVLP